MRGPHIDQWIDCAYHSAAPESNPKHNVYGFFYLFSSNHYFICDSFLIRTKINEKLPDLVQVTKHLGYFW